MNRCLPWVVAMLVLGLGPLPAIADSPTDPPPLTLEPEGEPSTRAATRTGQPSLWTWSVLIGVLGAGVAALRFWRPRPWTGLSTSAVDVLGRVPLNTKQQLHVVRFGKRVLLVAASETSASTLGELTDEAEVAELLASCHPEDKSPRPAISEVPGA